MYSSSLASNSLLEACNSLYPWYSLRPSHSVSSSSLASSSPLEGPLKDLPEGPLKRLATTPLAKPLATTSLAPRFPGNQANRHPVLAARPAMSPCPLNHRLLFQGCDYVTDPNYDGMAHLTLHMPHADTPEVRNTTKQDKHTRPTAKLDMNEHKFRFIQDEWADYKNSPGIRGKDLLSELWNK